MTANPQGEDPDTERVVIARAEGMLSARRHLRIADAVAALRADAHALGVPVVRLAEDLVAAAGDPGGALREGPRTVPAPLVALDLDVGRDLDAERALHEESRSRAGAPLVLDAATEAVLRTFLG